MITVARADGACRGHAPVLALGLRRGPLAVLVDIFLVCGLQGRLGPVVWPGELPLWAGTGVEFEGGGPAGAVRGGR